MPAEPHSNYSLSIYQDAPLPRCLYRRFNFSSATTPEAATCLGLQTPLGTVKKEGVREMLIKETAKRTVVNRLSRFPSTSLSSDACETEPTLTAVEGETAGGKVTTTKLNECCKQAPMGQSYSFLRSMARTEIPAARLRIEGAVVHRILHLLLDTGSSAVCMICSTHCINYPGTYTKGCKR